MKKLFTKKLLLFSLLLLVFCSGFSQVLIDPETGKEPLTMIGDKNYRIEIETPHNLGFCSYRNDYGHGVLDVSKGYNIYVERNSGGRRTIAASNAKITSKIIFNKSFSCKDNYYYTPFKIITEYHVRCVSCRKHGGHRCRGHDATIKKESKSYVFKTPPAPTNIKQNQSTIDIDPSTAKTQFYTTDNYDTYLWYKNNKLFATTKSSTSPYIDVSNGNQIYFKGKNNNTCNLLSQASKTLTVKVVPHPDYLELIKLYNSTNGANWKNKWDLSKPISTWHGITLTADGHSVKKINLKSNGLSGRVPNLNLPYLEELRLDYNQLSGSIPNFDFPYLKYLNLSKNQLSGSIPNFDLPNLWLLALNHNQLSGTIPNFDLPKLGQLYLMNNNQLSGSIPNFDLPKLEILHLNYNQLSGSIPNFDHVPNLVYLYVGGNQLSGTIPNFDLLNLKKLDLSINQLSGTIPNFDFPNLEYLSLAINQLSGSIPNFDFPKLEWLSLRNNHLSGPIPNFDFPNLSLLHIYNNAFTFQGIASNLNISDFTYSPQSPIPIYKSEGYKLYVKAGGGVENNTYKWYKDGTEYKTIVGDSVLIVAEPDSYYCKVTNRVVNGLVLQSDQITIDNPDYFELIKLYNATGGAYWKNKWDLSQPISTWHGVTLADDGSRVERLDLSENSLVGSLPNLNFPKLEVLKLDGNELSGSIPNLNLPKLEWLYLNNNQLSGVVPNFDHSLFYLNITNNDFTFKGIEFDLNDSNQYMSFNPQRPIPIYKSEEGILYVQAGGGVHNNTYTWYRNDEEYKTIVGDSALVVTIPGIYYCKIVNNALSQGDYNGEFVLQSNSIFSVMSYVEAKRLTRGISPQESEIVLFPNPAKGSVSIQIQGAKGKQVDIQVIDRLGNPRLERSVKPLTNARISLDISSLSQGHYYVRIKVGGKAVATKPLIISH